MSCASTSPSFIGVFIHECVLYHLLKIQTNSQLMLICFETNAAISGVDGPTKSGTVVFECFRGGTILLHLDSHLAYQL